ncbi:MAG TPA: ATP-binding protein, partial [Kofleriaceae bacterium]
APAPDPAPAAGLSAGLASLQLRNRLSTGPQLRRLGTQPPEPTPAPAPAPTPTATAPTAPVVPERAKRELSDAPAPAAVIRPPLENVVVALAPRVPPTRCTPAEYQQLLEHFRDFSAATALRAIAQDWDSGRLAFSTHDRPPFEAEVLGIVGRRAGLSPARVAEAGEALEESANALYGVRSGLDGKMSPFDLICAEHRIGRLGELVLLFVAAPALWGELARLYGILSNDSGRATCDEHLLWQLLGHATTRVELARQLDPDSPLMRYGLIQANERGRPFQGLTPDPIVIKLLAGATVDDDVEHGVAPVPASVALDQLMIPAKVIDRALADLAAAPPGLARIVVTGRSGSGRRTLLATLAEQAGRTLATIDAAMLIREKRVGALAGMLQHAHLRGWLPCVDGLDTIPSDDVAARGTVRELLRDHHGPLAVRLPRHVQPPVEPGYILIELTASTIAERSSQWTEILDQAGLTVPELDELAARFSVGPGTIKNVVNQVARGQPPDAGIAIENALRQYLESKLGTVATRVTRLANWSQIVLPADIHDSIVELVARIRHRRKVYDTWGFDQVMSTSRGLTALFQGGPGTGKTLVASAIANELGLDLYRIDLSRVMSKWIGETEQNLAKVFDSAEEGQALILFDEADSLFGKRTEVRTSVDRYANLETNYLLQRLDSFEGVAVLTTNFGTAIDAAFKRRLSARLTFPFPDDEARERLWRVHLPKQMPIIGELDLADLARRYKMSGGYIRNAALRAAFLAAEEGAGLSQDHLERAVRAEFREGGKLAESGFLE